MYVVERVSARFEDRAGEIRVWSRLTETRPASKRTHPAFTDYMGTILLAIRIPTKGNQVMSGLGTDTFMYKSPHRQSMASIGINTYETVNGSNCTCYSTNTCLTPAAIYSKPVESTFGVSRLNTNSTLVKGMRTACYPLEGVLSSTLEFNYSCRIPQASHLSMRVNRINFLPKPPYKISHKNLWPNSGLSKFFQRTTTLSVPLRRVPTLTGIEVQCYPSSRL